MNGLVMETLWQDFLSLFILACFALFIYARARKKDLKEVLLEIKELLRA